MAVDPSEVSNTLAPASNVVPGKRAASAQTVIQMASSRTVERINLEAMQQSFPDFLEADEDKAFVSLLTDKTVEHLNSGFQQAWAHLFSNSEFKEFTAKANQADEVFAAATQRRARREQPQDAWKQGADPIIAIAATTIPKLQGHLETVHTAETELAEQANIRVKTALDKQAEVEAVEREISSILQSIQEGARNMSSIDVEALRQLSESLFPLVSPDNL